MADIKQEKIENHPPKNPFKGAVVLPCQQEEFTQFIGSLLGKPQTIERKFEGFFNIDRENIENIFHLVDQRIRQQNDASLLQFTIKIIYDDRSSVLLNSLDELLTYNEVRPIISKDVIVTWIYLIKFQDKNYPERQEIELSFLSEDGGLFLSGGFGIGRSLYGSQSGSVKFTIKHTARSWGVDIESLISGAIENILKKESKFKESIYKYSDKIGLIFSMFFMIVVLFGVYKTTNIFINSQQILAKEYLSNLPDKIIPISNQINFLISQQVSGAWSRYLVFVLIFLFTTFILSIFIKETIHRLAFNRPHSFVILSKKSMEYCTRQKQKRKRQWRYLFMTLIGSIITGVIANYIFKILSATWLQ